MNDKNPKYPKGNGRTLLHIIAEKGYLQMLELIIENVDKKNPSDELGRTPLHITAEMDHLRMFRHIFENVDDKNPSDELGITPFQLAAENCNWDICEFVYDKLGPDVNKNLKKEPLVDPVFFLLKPRK